MASSSKNEWMKTVYFNESGNELVIIDQTMLPGELKYVRLKTPSQVWEAINELRVRGAPAIGISAAYGSYLGIRQSPAMDFDSFYNDFMKIKNFLASSRPTAVNLFWALDRMEDCLLRNRECPIDIQKQRLLHEADSIQSEDIQVCGKIGAYGLSLLKPNWGILTHCNAGRLATAKYGTALAPVYLGQAQGYHFKVFSGETRPLLQGARLTTYELHTAGVDVTLICDNMVSTVMHNGWIQAVFVGCDRVAANGDTVNKVGTSGIAILAQHYGIPFYVCAPTSTIDMQCKNGSEIKIEQRKPEEITEKWYKERMAPEGIQVFNPAFDITDAKHITAIITEYGIAHAPYNQSLRDVFSKKRCME